MKRLLLFLLCFCLTGCSYLGATEEILISSPYELSITKLETFGPIPESSDPVESETDGSGQPIVPSGTTAAPTVEITYIMISKTGEKIHYFADCSHAKRIKEENRVVYSVDKEDALLKEGYSVCSWCAEKRGG